MLELRSGDIVADDDGMEFVVLAANYASVYATFLYYLESNRKYVQTFNAIFYLQNRANIRVKGHMDYNALILKMKMSERVFLYNDAICYYENLKPFCVQLYTNKENKQFNLLIDTKVARNQFYYKDWPELKGRVGFISDTLQEDEYYDYTKTSAIKEAHLKIGDIVENPTFESNAPELRVVLGFINHIPYCSPLSTTANMPRRLQTCYAKVGHLNRNSVLARYSYFISGKLKQSVNSDDVIFGNIWY